MNYLEDYDFGGENDISEIESKEEQTQREWSPRSLWDFEAITGSGRDSGVGSREES